MDVVTLVHRVLHPNPIISLEDHVTRGGGKGLTAALEMEPDAKMAASEKLSPSSTVNTARVMSDPISMAGTLAKRTACEKDCECEHIHTLG